MTTPILMRCALVIAAMSWPALAGERRFDLPGGGKRMVMPSTGVECTIVNGVVTYARGELTGAAAGRILRS